MTDKYKILDALISPTDSREPSGAEDITPKKQVIDNSSDPIGVSGEVKSPPPQDDSILQDPPPSILDKLKTGANEYGEKIKNNLIEAGEGISNTASEIGDSIQFGINSSVETVKNITDEYPNFWVGAAPLLMGALVGDIGEGAKVGGANLTKVYDNQVKGYQAKKTASIANKNPVTKVLLNEEGVPTLHKWDGVRFIDTGMVAATPSQNIDMASKLAETRNKIKNKYSLKDYMAKNKHIKYSKDSLGRDVAIDTLTGYRTRMTDEELGKVQLDGLNTARKELEGHALKKIETTRNLQRSLENVTSDNMMGTKGAIMQFVKEAQGGKPSDYDVVFITSAFGGLESAKQKMSEFVEGKMKPERRKEFIDMIQKGIRDANRSAVESYNRALSIGRSYEIPDNKLREYLGAPPAIFPKALMSKKSKDGKIQRIEIKNSDIMDSYLKNGWTIDRYLSGL